MLVRPGGNEPVPLELRLERLKRFGNLKLDFLQRLYNRRPIGEQYRQGDRELHIHFLPGATCATFRAPVIEWDRLNQCTTVSVTNGCGEFAMPVWVRDITQASCPLASVVRLQPLDRCYMRGVDSPQCADTVRGVFPSREALWVIFNRELDTYLRRPGIVLGEFMGEVFKRRPEVVARLADQHAKPERENRLHHHAHDPRSGREGEVGFIRGIKIELVEQAILLDVFHFPNSTFQVSKVFTCPVYSLESAVERMELHRLHSIHGEVNGPRRRGRKSRGRRDSAPRGLRSAIIPS